MSIKVSGRFRQFFSTTDNPVDIELVEQQDGILTTDSVFYNVYCNMEFYKDANVLIECWNNEMSKQIIVDGIDNILVNGENFEITD